MDSAPIAQRAALVPLASLLMVTIDTPLMQQPSTSQDDVMECVRAAIERLAAAGYGDFVSSFHPFEPSEMRWAAARSAAAPELRPLLDLFLFAAPVEEEQVRPVLGDLVTGLIDARLVERLPNGRLRTPGLSLLLVVGNWLFCQRYRTNPTLYFGADSMALLLRLRPPAGGRTLDLCAGPGIQSLHCARFAAEVDAVEVNPAAAAVGTVNVALNGLESRVRYHVGDLYAAVAGERFDHVVANPPLLPFPESIPYPFVGHGGRDGLRVTWRILRGLPAALAQRGHAQVIGTCLSDGILPLPQEALAEWAAESSMDVTMTVTSHVPLGTGERYFESLVDTAVSGTELDRESVAATYDRELREQGATHLSGYLLGVRHGKGRFRVQDVAEEPTRWLWYG